MNLFSTHGSVMRELAADPSALATRCVCPSTGLGALDCGCAIEPVELLPTENLTTSGLLRRDETIAPPEVTGGVPGGGIVSKIVQGISDFLKRDQTAASPVTRDHDGLVSRCICPSTGPNGVGPPPACGCVLTPEDLDPALRNITSLLDGRDVTIAPPEETGGVPGGGILSKIAQGISSLF